jgi:ankyrin repeat protein
MISDEAQIARYEELLALALDYARNGEKGDLERMLKAKLPVNLCDHKGNTLLMLSAYNGNADIVKMLINYGADVNKKNDRGQAPLAGACFKGYLDVVKLLVEGGADRHENNGFGTTAIMFAAMFGNHDIVEYLLGREKSFSSKIYLGFAKFAALFRGRGK